MNVSLTPELEKYIANRVKGGMFGSASEVVRNALRLMREHEAQLERLRRDVQVGIEQLERGEGIPMDAKAIESIKSEGRRRLAERRKKRAS